MKELKYKEKDKEIIEYKKQNTKINKKKRNSISFYYLAEQPWIFI